MNIMVVGAGGMLSSDLVPYLNETGHTCKGFTIDELDITNINTIRNSDIVVRYGGEEIIVLLVDV
ncbi:MAG: hypothetical protein HQK92_06665, partial [Nitrospirae bacterium]|nr:hypothetical protein [Nitrospirota bacterium]